MEDCNCSPCIFIGFFFASDRVLSDADVNLVQSSEMLYLCMEEEEGEWKMLLALSLAAELWT